jgi:predicted CXXCH cytochrome family protein
MFNEGLGTCTRCHQIPEREFDLGGGAKFSHELAYERGVDCASCHGDLIRGRGDVPRERCTVCHNRPEDLNRIDDEVLLHQKHVAEHNVDCLDCHLAIQHSLDPHRIEHAAGDCAACHANQHREQVRMLLGTGGKSMSGGAPGRMAVAGLTCRSCHQAQETSPTGTVAWKASMAVCSQCHDEAATERLLVIHEQLKGSLADIGTDLVRAREALTAANLDESKATEIAQRLGDLQDDLEFLRVGNSIHNMHYADSLTRALVDKLRAVYRDLSIAEPTFNLPPGIGAQE